MRYQVETDGLTTRPRFDRRYAVVDTAKFDSDGKPAWVLQTDDARRASDYAYELNCEAKDRAP
jgi:hypothetical protein